MKPLKNNGIFTISTGEPDFFHQLLKVSLLPAGLASADESDVFETGGKRSRVDRYPVTMQIHSCGTFL